MSALTGRPTAIRQTEFAGAFFTALGIGSLGAVSSGFAGPGTPRNRVRFPNTGALGATPGLLSLRRFLRLS